MMHRRWPRRRLESRWVPGLMSPWRVPPSHSSRAISVGSPERGALSRATMRNIRQNLFLAFAYNMIGVPVAAGVLYPIFGLLITPMWASAAMTLSSLSVIGNALRLRRASL